MNRILFSITALLSAAVPLLFDSALKGAALLSLASVVALGLWKASAATRHLVWLVAVAALLVLPVLSVALPQWRVLPKWTASLLADGLPPAAKIANEPYASPETNQSRPARMLAPANASSAPTAPLPARATSHAALITPRKPAPTWRDGLPLAWVAGFTLLMVRVVAAHLLLRRAARNCLILVPRLHATSDAIIAAFAAACAQLGIRQRVTLLLDERRTIPVVWGVFRPRLLLPAEAREWSDEQLLSVLLHELAHIQRRDTVVQWLTQIACALHWFNPLVWLAAWRLHTERERACDDLVLASGVRPSAYAEHLLHVATKLSPARWTSACGLAMARQSSLEGRLLAVLSGGRNRRSVTRILVAAGVILAAAVAIPLAMLRAAQPDKPKADAGAVNAEPKGAGSRALFNSWKASARSDGKIPGGRIGEMAASLKTFMDLNPGHEQSGKLEPVVKKCDSSRDWTPAEAAALLDEIAGITPRAEWTMRAITERRIHPGKPLPGELANAPWGQPAANGLRIAWLLEPRAETQALDSVMKSRVLFHNTGRAPVCFATEDWIQSGGHKANDASGKDISVHAVSRMGLRTRMIFRLAPGEYAEVEGHGLGVGSHKTSSEKSIYKVGCWIEAKEGDVVTFTPGSVPVSFQTWQNNEGRKDSVTVWQEMIAARVMQESPMPAAAADREQLLRRVIKDLFGTDPSAQEIAAFIADNAPDALARLIKNLQARAGAMHFAGALSGGETKFRVTAAEVKEKPKQGAQLKPSTEKKLKWGEPANGLRMALAWPPSLGEPGIGDEQEFYLVVQNVSRAAVRLTANDAAPNPRKLTLHDETPVSRTVDEVPIPGDSLLQPREAAFVRLFHSDEKLKDGRTLSAAKEQIVRVQPQYSYTAEMSIEKAPQGAWTGKLSTGETRGSVDVIPPQSKDAQALYKSWTTASRAPDGAIPGALIGTLADSVKTFIMHNPTWETTPQLEKMLPRFDATRDWSGPDAVALLDELAALQSTPITMALERENTGLIRTGTPLPAQLANAPWGEALSNGLRHAWLLEPRAAEHPLGTPLKARVLIHNAGKKPVVFRTRTWHQLRHKASDAKGADLKIESTSWTTRGLLLTYRLAPGEFIEVNAPGIGVGPVENHQDWQQTRVGSWIEAKAGDEVTVTTEPLPLSDWKEKPETLGSEPRWWLDHIRARLARHLPFPADADARLRLLHRVAIEVFGTSVSKETNDAFVADRTPAALDSAAKRLFHFPDLQAWAGPLTSGPTKFRVLPADPDAAKKPRTANNPGHYTISEKASLEVSRRDVGERIVNEAHLSLSAPGERHDITLPDGYDTWAAAWVRGATVMWVTQKGLLRKIDFTNPAKVEETRFEADEPTDAPIPPDIREALIAALTVPDASKQIQEPLKPTAPASAAEKPKGAAVKLTPDGLLGFWRGERKGEAMMLSFHRPPVATDGQLDIYYGNATIGVPASFTFAADGASVAVTQHSANGRVPLGTLHPGEAGTLWLEFSDEKNARPERGGIVFTRDADGSATEPRQKEARELFAMWKATSNDDGTIPGTFIGMLAAEVRAYVKAHPNYDSAMKLPKLLSRFDTSRDWTQAEAIKLLDDVAYYATAPIEARVAKAKLPSGPLWRTMVPFEDIPVAIAKWSEAKDGLRIGMRVMEGEWRIGGKVRMELWLHNAGEMDVSFKSTGPNRQDTGVAVSAVGADGREHWAENGNATIIAIPLHCTLPAGYVAKAKDVTLSFDAPDNNELAWFAPKFRELAPGKYKLRCQWSDPHPLVSTDGDWTGVLAAPELEFMLVARDAPKTVAERKVPPVDGPPARPRLPNDSYARSGVPLAEQAWPMPPWGAEKDGLSAGLRVIGDARIGGEVKAELWVRNSSVKDVKFSQNSRSDIGLSVVAKDKDGKEHAADITQFDGYPVFLHLLLPPGHVVKVKQFAVRLDAQKNNALAAGVAGFHLPPGDYKLHAKWSDSHALVTHADDWTGELISGEVDLKIATADAAPGVNSAPQRAKLPDDAYTKSGVPIGELTEPMTTWSGEQNGLSVGLRVAEDAQWRIGGAVKVELWVCNPGEKDVKFQWTDRRDIGLRVKIKGADGKEHDPEEWFKILGQSDILCALLPAGHIMKVKEFPVRFMPAQNGGLRFVLPPGEYKFRCELNLPGETAIRRDGTQATPAEGEWTGTLKSGELDVKLVAPEAPMTDADSGGEKKPPPGEGEPVRPNPAATEPKNTAARGAPRESGMRISVVDNDGGKPIPEFRVVAGVKSGVSSKIEGVVNWQPHTLRTGKDGELTWPLEKAYDEFALRVEAEGYAPQTSAWLRKSEGAKDIFFTLAKDPGISGRLLTLDGKPAAGAMLALAMVQRDAVIENGKLRGLGEPLPEKPGDRWRRPVFAQTDTEGRFHVPQLADATAAVLILHENGVRELPLAEFAKAPDVTLQPWGRVEGRVLWGGRAGANEEISLIIHRDTYGYPGVVAQYENAKSDADGRFVFDKVLPGRVQLSRAFTFPKPTKSNTTSVMLPGMVAHVTVRSGEPTAALIGGRGRTVKGRLTGRDSWDQVRIHFHPRAPRPGNKDAWTAQREFQNSAMGPLFFRSDLKPNADGTFEIPNVLPGEYQLFVAGNAGYRQFSVASEQADAPPAPLDLGEIAVKPAEANASGDKARGAEAQPPEKNPAQLSSVPEKPWMATGRVTDAGGMPLADVEIWVHTGMGSLKRTGLTKTGVDGRYTVQFGRGILMPVDTPNLQVANVTAHKPGYFEKNLSRQGARAAALREISFEDLKTYGTTAKELFLPGKPQTIDFAMAPAARVKGRLLGTGVLSNVTPQEAKKQPQLIAGFTELRQSPLAGWRVWLVGKELPPGSSVLASAETDAEGNFVFENVPTGFKWQFQTDTHRQQPEPKSPPFTLDAAPEASFELELPEDQTALRFLPTKAAPPARSGA